MAERSMAALPLFALALGALLPATGCQSEEEKAVELVEEIAEVFEAHGDGDCDKLAARLDAVLKENKEALSALAQSDANKDARKRSAKHRARIDKAFGRILDHAAKCGAEPAVAEVVQKIM